MDYLKKIFKNIESDKVNMESFENKVEEIEEVCDPNNILQKNTKPNYYNFLKIFVVDVSPWVFYKAVGVNIETNKLYFLDSQMFNIGGAYGSNDRYQDINSKERLESYIEMAFNNGKISIEECEKYKELSENNWISMVDSESCEDKLKDLKYEEERREKSKLNIKREEFVGEDTLLRFEKLSSKSYPISDFVGFKYRAYSMNNGEFIYLRKINGRHRLLYIHCNCPVVDELVENEEAIKKTLRNENIISSTKMTIIDRFLEGDELWYILTEVCSRLGGKNLERAYDYSEHIGCYGDFSLSIMPSRWDRIKSRGNDYIQCSLVCDFMRVVRKVALKEYRIV